MKLKKVAEACMWLPGFGPEEDPREVLGTLGAQQATAVLELALRELAPKARKDLVEPTKPTWPTLSTDFHNCLQGDVEKFEANIKAIETLRALESAGRDPDEDERSTLNLYTGWGGLTRAFNTEQSDSAWATRSKQLLAFLTESEYAAASVSTLNAHYTPIHVIQTLWAALERLGFKGGRVIEPAAGVGYFLGAMPQELASNSTVTAVEIDEISSRITAKLYRSFGVRVEHCGFEVSKSPDGFADLCISNVPFDKSGVPEARNVPYANWSVHNYFFAKALEVVRPGGLVAFITSSFTLDAIKSDVRAYLSSQADLVGAIRLPAGTFKHLANTNVTADIVILQKRVRSKHSTPQKSHAWVESVLLPKSSPLCDVPWYAKTTNLWVNEHFATRPDFVIGKLSMKKAQFGEAMTCEFDGDIESALKERVGLLPADVYSPAAKPEERYVKREEAILLEGQYRDGLAVLNGSVVEIFNNEARAYKASGKVLDRILGLIEIRDATRKLIAAQCKGDSDGKLDAYRTALSVAYDTFVAKHGYVGEKANRKAFEADPDLPLVMSLELWDEETRSVEKAAIFSRRTIGAYRTVDRCESTAEALQVCMGESARVIPRRVATLLGRDEDEVMAELEEAGAVYLDPMTLKWVDAGAYLSGDVREKLLQAQSAGARFERNVRSLESVLPEDLSPFEITVRIGSTWIPCRIYSAFLDELLGKPDHQVFSDALTGTWDVSTPWSADFSIAATQTWGTDRVSAQRLFELALNQQEPTVYDKRDGKPVANTEKTIAARDKQYQLKERFAEWVWSDDARAKSLTRIYNDQFNSFVPRTFNGEHLVLPGMSEVYTLRAHQRDAVWRVISSEFNTLLAHAVGAGKTLEMICSAMELRRIGKASKPMIAVPGHVLVQVASEFLRAYPGAKVLMATKEDLTGDRRKLMTSRIASGDWDAVIVTHSCFERLALSDEYMKSFYEEELERVECAIRSRSSASKSNRIVRQLARAKKTWEKKLKALSNKERKDDLLTFEELGIDWIMYDESHLAKNLFKFTKMDRIAGMANSNSDRAFDLFAKSRYVMDARGDYLGLTQCTATPIANTVPG